MKRERGRGGKSVERADQKEQKTVLRDKQFSLHSSSHIDSSCQFFENWIPLSSFHASLIL